MFTGLVEGIGKVKGINRTGGDMVLTLLPLFDISDAKIGDSVSVSGVCLTVTRISERGFSVDVSEETLSRSTLRDLKQGDEVNLERALRVTDRLGGHLVLGHVDGVGRILRREQKQRSWVLRIGLDPGLSKYIIEKGSIAVDGVSLTVNQCDETGFEVNIIPQTGRETTILKKQIGDPVNVETDLIGKYVEKFFMKQKSRGDAKERPAIDEEMLRKFGFGD
jgi:riboflavin synthase